MLGATAVVAMGWSVCSAPALAQDKAETADDGTLREIVVTAQRRNENIQDVPISITAVSGEALRTSGVVSTQDISLITPGLQFQQAVGNSSPFIRGVGSQAVGPGNEASVATYIDGVYLASGAGGLFSLNGIERIEVLKGPQGTLFGRNATGGLVHIITRDPTFEPGFEGSVGYGNYDTFEARAYATAGLASNIAFNVAGFYRRQGDGFGRNLVTGRDVNRADREMAARGKLLFRPSADTRIRLAADYNESRGTSLVSVRPFPGSVSIAGAIFQGRYWDIASDFQPRVQTHKWIHKASAM